MAVACHAPMPPEGLIYGVSRCRGASGKLRLYLSMLWSAESIPAFVEANPFATFACPHVPLPLHPPHPSPAPAQQAALKPQDPSDDEEEVFEEDEIVLQGG